MSLNTRTKVFGSRRRAFSHCHSVVTADYGRGGMGAASYFITYGFRKVVIYIHLKFCKEMKSRKIFVNKSRINSVV
jgi:hypothetical protein